MTSKEFTLWLKGFTDGVHEYNITPKQWDLLKEKLAEVKDETSIGFPFGTPTTAPIQTLPFIQPHDPYNPFKINCGDTNGTTITTTPGTGYITTYNPIQFGSGSYNPMTTTLWNPSGSAWSYTTSNQPFSTQDDDSLKPTKQSKFKKRKAKSVKEWEDTYDLGGEE
jgi:hypothetical protein